MRQKTESHQLANHRCWSVTILSCAVLAACGGGGDGPRPSNTLPAGITEIGNTAYLATAVGAGSTATTQDLLTGGVGNIIGTFFGVLSLSTIQNIVSSAGLDQAWWTGITIAAMLCLFLVVQSVVIARKKKMLQK